MHFWRYRKDMQTSYFGHAWSHTPKMMVSTCWWLRCLSACEKYTSSFTSFFRYYILKNPAIWLADSILAHNLRIRILPDRDCCRNINNTSFHFRLFPRKTNEKGFQKIQKTLFRDQFGHFGQKRIFLGKRAVPVSRYSNYLPSCQKSEKTTQPFLRKTPN